MGSLMRRKKRLMKKEIKSEILKKKKLTQTAEK